VKKVAIILGMAVLGTWACNSHPGNKKSAIDQGSVRKDTQPISADTVSRYRSYTGVLPCTDCSGIRTTINLMGDFSYQKLSSRIGKNGKKSGETQDETGRWALMGKDTVQLLDVTDGPNKYLETDSSLVQLDLNGSRITGSDAARFELKKVK
jgi:copper homeostasis protein (lipoprotein)